MKRRLDAGIFFPCLTIGNINLSPNEKGDLVINVFESKHDSSHFNFFNSAINTWLTFEIPEFPIMINNDEIDAFDSNYE